MCNCSLRLESYLTLHAFAVLYQAQGWLCLLLRFEQNATCGKLRTPCIAHDVNMRSYSIGRSGVDHSLCMRSVTSDSGRGGRRGRGRDGPVSGGRGDGGRGRNSGAPRPAPARPTATPAAAPAAASAEA